LLKVGRRTGVAPRLAGRWPRRGVAPDCAFPGAGRCGVSFRVEDIREAVTVLETRGVDFAEYDLPGLKTVDHVCVLGSEKAVWFSDPEGNLLCLHEDLGLQGA
jgi:hypothetical protein